ncbi:heparan sulfate glucosamine 3-O-sulfotransferase 1-like [Diadema antillarum]|uniref:heparan sulfate glucosamine 3-O-sulfotransferase 1-like n=1 Tax=Diadema antillarum TaxID=105358 RepID=UPI003A86C3A3
MEDEAVAMETKPSSRKGQQRASDAIQRKPNKHTTKTGEGVTTSTGDGVAPQRTPFRSEAKKHDSPYSLSAGDCQAWKPNSREFKAMGCRHRLPQAMIVGVKKCGTTMLRKFMAHHPAVSMVPGETPYPSSKYLNQQGIHSWRQKMTYSTPAQLTITEAPSYLSFPLISMKRLKAYLPPNTKVIVIIKDAVERAISDYVHVLTVLESLGVISLPLSAHNPLRLTGKFNFVRETFKKTVINKTTRGVKENSIISHGRYVEGLRKLASVYGRDHLLVIDGKAFIDDPLPIMWQVERFLDLPAFFQKGHFNYNSETGFYCESFPLGSEPVCPNPRFKGRKHPIIANNTLAILRRYYKPFNQQLKDEFGVSFPWL